MKKHLIAAIILIILIAAITFPLVFKVTTHIPGFFSSDEPYAPLWDSWRIQNSYQHHSSFADTNLIRYPQGAKLYESGYLTYLWIGWFYFLSIFTTPVLAYNIQILFNFFLAGIFTYFLIFYLTARRPAALFGAIIFAFCPYQFSRAWQHLSLTYNQWIPMAFLAAIALKENPSRKNLLFFAAAIFMLFSFDYTIMFLTGIGLLAWFGYAFIYYFRRKGGLGDEVFKKYLSYFKKSFVAGVLVLAILSPQFFPIIKNRLMLSSKTQAGAYNSHRRSFNDLFEQSARPLSYFLPPATHPVLGKFTESLVGSNIYGSSFTEHALYLGWLPLAFAFLAYRRWRKNQKRKGVVKDMRDAFERITGIEKITAQEDIYLGFFIWLAVVAWLFSQPPWWEIGPLKIYMPSFFMYKLLPMFRAYCRFGIVLQLAVAVLAAFGLKYIMEKYRGKIKQRIIAGLCCGVVLFEFWSWPPYKVINVSKAPEVYSWLKNQPGNFVIAQYPLDVKGPNDVRKFYQIFHHRPMINATLPDTESNEIAKKMVKLSDFKTARQLAAMKVKYVLVHRQEYLDTELVSEREELGSIAKNHGLRFVRNFSAEGCDPGEMCVQVTGPVDVYEVVAKH